MSEHVEKNEQGSSSSRFFKARKYVMSRMTETKGGRSFIVSHFGPEGHVLIRTLKAAAAKFAGNVEAKALKMDLLKIITKAVLLHSNKAITAETALPAREPTLACLQCVTDTLDPDHGAGRTCRATAPSTLHKSIMTAHDALLPLLTPHVRARNSQRLTRVMTFYGDEKFLEAFLAEGPEYARERAAVFRALVALTRPFETEMKATTAFLADQLRSQATSLRRITGATPNLRGLLDHDLGSEAWARWLHETRPKRDMDLFKLVAKCRDYKTTANLRLRKPRADQIRRDFLIGGDLETALSKQHVQACIGRLDKAAAASSPPPSNVFDDLHDEAMALLDALFQSAFVTSAAFDSLRAKADDLQARAEAHAHVDDDDQDTDSDHD